MQTINIIRGTISPIINLGADLGRSVWWHCVKFPRIKRQIARDAEWIREIHLNTKPRIADIIAAQCSPSRATCTDGIMENGPDLRIAKPLAQRAQMPGGITGADLDRRMREIRQRLEGEDLEEIKSQALAHQRQRRHDRFMAIAMCSPSRAAMYTRNDPVILEDMDRDGTIHDPVIHHGPNTVEDVVRIEPDHATKIRHFIDLPIIPVPMPEEVEGG